MKNKLVGGLTAISIAIAVLTPFEGRFNKGYADPVGIPTGGVGHTGADVVVGRVYSDATVDEWLVGDATKANEIVRRCTPAKVLEGSPKREGALTSFAFNVGAGGKGIKDGYCILRSGAEPRHIRLFKAGDIRGGCTALLAWTKAKGRVLRGLKRRRIAEVNLCVAELT